MEIRNAIIITDEDSVLHLSVEEMENFTGNVVFSRARLSQEFNRQLDDEISLSAKDNASASDGSRPSMKTELVR